MAPSGDKITLASSSNEQDKLILSEFPSEILDRIFDYAEPSSDIFSLSLVCNRFHELAAKRLYRKVSHTFSSDSSLDNRQSLSRLTDVLESLVTSGRKYSRHLKVVELDDAIAMGPDRSAVNKSECGYIPERLFTRLLISLVKKASTLERLKWEVRNHISVGLLAALSEHPTFQDLHVRLLPGSLIDEPVTVTPMPPSFGAPTQVLYPIYHHFEDIQNIQNIHSSYTVIDPGPAWYSQPQEPIVPSRVVEVKPKPVIESLSNFSGLQKLAVLDIDDLGYIPELANCVASSAASLRTLKLSFSESFAWKARKPKTSESNANAAAGSATAVVADPLESEDTLANFLGGPDPSRVDQEIAQYREAQNQALEEILSVGRAESSIILDEMLGESLASAAERAEEAAESSEADSLCGEEAQPCSSIFNMHPINDVLPSITSDTVHEPDLQVATCHQMSRAAEQVLKTTKSDDGNENESSDPLSSSVQIGESRDGIETRGPWGTPNEPEIEKKAYDQHLIEYFQYMRRTRGMPLEELSICFIPVDVLVLNRALDLTSLRHLSLLNIGPQRVIWSTLQKMQNHQSLQLTSVHSDDVTGTLLTFLNGLDKLTELFLFERPSASKSLPETTVTMRQITEHVLSKHMPHLKRLVLRNDQSSEWALDMLTVRLIIPSSTNLLELGVGVTVGGYRAFVQHIGSLRSLKAIQLFYYCPELCTTLLSELRTNIVSHILHYRNRLRVDYVAMSFVNDGPLSNEAIQIKEVPIHTSVDSQEHQNPYTGITAEESQHINALLSYMTHGPIRGPSYNANMALLMGRVADITKVPGIKMWDKGVWHMKL